MHYVYSTRIRVKKRDSGCLSSVPRYFPVSKHRLRALRYALLLFCSSILICPAPGLLHAQSFSKKENYQWVACGYYGIGYGMSFSTNPPQGFSAAQIGVQTYNGTSSVADKNGNLLFYTDGNIIWDRNHNVMLNGWDINNDGSGTSANYLYDNTWGIMSGWNFDGVAIIPIPGSSHKYYIFGISDSLMTTGEEPFISTVNAWEGRLRYCIVDMDLNNGLGAVDTPHKAIVIADSMAGNLQVVTGEDCNYWLVGYGSDGAYRSFNITSAGIDTTPVISTVTLPLSPVCYELNISPDRSKLVQTFGEEAQVCDFDPATGIVSNSTSIGTQECIGGAFSPNSSKLYLNGLIGIRQYDLSVSGWPWTLLTVNNLTAPEYDRPIRLGPDGMIYGMYFTVIDGWMDYEAGFRIQHPDLAGTACLFDTFPNAPLIIRSYFSAYQLPNEVAVLTYDTVSSVTDSPLCFGADSTVLRIDNVTGTDFHWKKNTIGPNYYPVSGDTLAYAAGEPGTYTVAYYTADPCLFHQDTFIVKDIFFSLNLKGALSCEGEPVMLEPGVDNAQFLWQDGSTNDHFEADTSSRYWVQVTSNGCTATDSADVTILDLRQNLDGQDTTLCMEDKTPVELNARVPPGATALWSTGETTAKIQAGDTGIYWVRVSDSTCMVRDSVIIHKEYCDCPVLIPNAFTPNGDGVNDTYEPSLPGECPVSELKMQIYNRWGQMIFVTYDPTKGWDGTYDGKPADGGVYYFTIKMKLGRDNMEVMKKGSFTLIR